MKLKFLAVLTICLLGCGAAFGASISLSISGSGAINDSTIVAGEPVTFDMYMENDMVNRGFTMGFKITSSDIKKIVHVADSGNGMNERGDLKAFNGWQDKSIWDLNGLFLVEANWDGALPDTLGLGGICVKQEHKPHKKQKCVSFDVMVPTTGTFVIDSSFFPPSGIWIFVNSENAGYEPEWAGPYNISVVSKEAANKLRPPKNAEPAAEGKK